MRPSAYDAPTIPATEPSRARPAARSALHVQAVGRGDVPALGHLFGHVDTTFFRPHPMTLGEAERISSLGGRDVYLIGYAGHEAVAYGMLRGWDEGFSTPSLGVAVRGDRTRLGFGRAMMHALHDAARTAGSDRVRLRVNPANLAALSLYRSLGYRPAGFERGELVMYLDL